MLPGTPERRTFDYARAGTTDLFAALDVATGLVIHSIQRQHRAPSSRSSCPTSITVPAELHVHLICDNLSTHKTPAIGACSPPTHDSICTSPRPAPPGSTKSNAVRAPHRPPDPPRRPHSIPALERDIESWIKN